MKLAKGMELIAQGWIVKPKGFRVRFQKMTDGQWVTSHSPPLYNKPLDSDVTTWRYAWKLAMAAPLHGEKPDGESLVNVTVVDEMDTPVVYYATGEQEVYNWMLQEDDKGGEEGED